MAALEALAAPAGPATPRVTTAPMTVGFVPWFEAAFLRANEVGAGLLLKECCTVGEELSLPLKRVRTEELSPLPISTLFALGSELRCPLASGEAKGGLERGLPGSSDSPKRP